MRRSMSALGGALIALTLAAGPAWAGSPGQQSVTHSAGAVQIGADPRKRAGASRK